MIKIPVYLIDINLDDEESGMTAISLVEDPAVEKDFICFNKDQKPMQFKVEDELEHKVTGVAIWANKEIYRYEPTVGEYYVVFTPEAIDKIVHKYAKQGLQNLVDLQHDGKMVDGVVMVEYFIKDSSKGINPAGFEDVDDGSLFVTYKIEDDKLWNEIISPDSEFKGFSIEIYADIVPTDRYVEVNDEEYEDAEFMNWLEELLKALEDADCEIIMESDKDKWLVNGDGEYWLDEEGNKVPAKCPKCGADVGVYIKGEPVFLCSECGEYLGTVKFPDDEMFSVNIKKKIELESDEDDDEDGLWSLNFEIERSDISKLIGKSAKIDGVDYWVYGISKDKGKDAAILYNPNKEKYIVKPLTSIRELTPLKADTGTFPPLPNEIIDNDNITVQKTIISNTIPDIMKNHIFAQLSYDDELPHPHTGSRQVAIVAEGYTKAGNHCFRAYELFGDSRSAAEEPLPSWRLFLTKRVRSLKAMVGTEPFTMDWLNSLSPAYNWEGDRSMEPCINHITIEDFIN